MRTGINLASALGGYNFQSAGAILVAGAGSAAGFKARTGDLIWAAHETLAGTPGQLSAALNAPPGGDNALIDATSSNALDTSSVAIYVLPRAFLEGSAAPPALQSQGYKNALPFRVRRATLVAGSVVAPCAPPGQGGGGAAAVFRLTQGGAPGFLAATWTSLTDVTVTSSNGADDADVLILVPFKTQTAGGPEGFAQMSEDAGGIDVVFGTLVAGSVVLGVSRGATGTRVLPFRASLGGAPGFLTAAVSTPATPAAPLGGAVTITSSNGADVGNVGAIIFPAGVA